MQRLRGGAHVDFYWSPILENRSEVVTVPENMRWLRLQSGETEVERRELRIAPGETLVLTL